MRIAVLSFPVLTLARMYDIAYRHSIIMAVIKCKGAALKSLRKKLGFTQKQMAETLEVSRRETISDWETGKHDPSFSWEQVKKLDELADQIGIRLKDLPNDLIS